MSPPDDVLSSDSYTTQEKLLLAQAVHKLGAVAWPAVSKLLVEHPCIAGAGRPERLFTPEGCEAGYVALMGDIGMNVPAEGAMKPHAKCHLRLAQTFYLARMNELKSSISTYESRFATLMNEIQQIKSGQLDASIRAELRAVLARKYGKRLLDSWVPDEDEVKSAVEAGPVSEAEERAEVEQEEASVDVEPVQTSKEEEEEDQEEDQDQEITSPAKSPAPSELSPPPSAAEEESPPTTTTAPARASKRKASIQPKGAPASKRSGRRGASSPVATPVESDAEPEPASEGIEETKDLEEEDVAPSRGRRATKYSRKLQSQDSPAASARTKDSSPAVSRRAPSVSSTTSGAPAEDRRTSSRRGKPSKALRDNVVSKSVREQTVESVKEEQADEDAEEEEERPARRSGRRGAKEGTADEDADGEEGEEKPTRRSGRRGAKEETVEEDADDEQTTRRSGRRGTKGEPSAAAVSTPAPADKDKKSKRGSIKTPVPVAAEHEGDSGKEEDEEDDGETNTPTSAIPAHMSRERDRAKRQSSPRDTKAAQKMLLALLDAVSGHRNGNVFLGPVKKSDAPDYYEIIKRPMDLKTIRQRIRDSQVLSIDEFERDVALMFTNAMMYNSPGSQVYEMAEQMRGETESTIAHFRSMQHEMGRSQV